jgi:ATP-dependent Lon protease
MFKFPDGSLRLVVQGVQRFRLQQVNQYRPYIRANIELLQDVIRPEHEIEVQALAQSAQGLFQRVVELSPTLSDELQALAANIQDPSRLADFVAGSCRPSPPRRSRRCSRSSTSAPGSIVSTRSS